MPDNPLIPEQSLPEDELEALTRLIPEAKELEPADKSALAGVLRRKLIHEREDESESVSIFRVEEAEALTRMIRSLPLYSSEEIAAHLAELELAPEEAQMEAANWAVRYQSVRGDLLVQKRLIPFRLVRLHAYTYLLLSLGGEADLICEGFSRAFGQNPDVHSRRAVHDAEHIWTSWAWFLDPDRESARRDAEQLRQLWEGLEA